MMILVFARRFENFREWCRVNNIHPLNKHILFVSHESKVRGVRDPLVLRLPGYREHPVWDDPGFGDLLKSREWHGPLLNLTEKQSLELVEFMDKYPWAVVTYATVAAYLSTYKGDVSRETGGVQEGD